MPTTEIIELRQYATHPQQRDVLIEVFDRALVESQEDVGMRVLGQFRDHDDPDRFVWLRGFPNMAERARGLQAFYGGPVWAANRDVANATMADSDNVLLLRPAWPGAAADLAGGQRAPVGAAAIPDGLFDITVFRLKERPGAQLLAFVRERVTPVLRAGGASQVSWCVTETSANTFPRLPVREGENVLVGMAMFDSVQAFDTFLAGGAWQREIAPALSQWVEGAAQALRLEPTARSAIQA